MKHATLPPLEWNATRLSARYHALRMRERARMLQHKGGSTETSEHSGAIVVTMSLEEVRSRRERLERVQAHPERALSRCMRRHGHWTHRACARRLIGSWSSACRSAAPQLKAHRKFEAEVPRPSMEACWDSWTSRHACSYELPWRRSRHCRWAPHNIRQVERPAAKAAQRAYHFSVEFAQV